MLSYRNLFRVTPLIRLSIYNTNILITENLFIDNNKQCAISFGGINSTQQQIRNYAKNKDKKKDKKNIKIEINEQLLSTAINLELFNNQMQKSLDTMKDEFTKNLSLRSTTGSIEKLKINLDGKEHELQELGQIIRKNPKTIVINMIGFPQTIPTIIQTIQKSGMNLNPTQDGTTIFIPVPKVTREHRENLSKNAKTLFIKCKEALRDIQMNQIKKLKKQTDISSDDNYKIQNQLIAIADKYISEADKILELKQNELIGAGKE